MAAAVESPSSSSSKSDSKLFSRSLRWREKLFKSNKAHEVKEDIVEGAKGGPPAPGAAPLPGVEDNNALHNVAGLNVENHDATLGGAANHDSQQEERLLNAPPASSSSQPSPRQLEKQRSDDVGGGKGEEDDDDVDPTAGAGALSSGTRRSSVAPGVTTDEEDDDDDNVDDTTEATRITFFHRDQPYFWLSNSSDHPVYLDGIRYPTAEHLFQSLKFLPHKPDIAAKIRKASTPSDATREARKQSTNVKRGWISQGKNVEAMRFVLLLKFTQHSALHKKLLQTNDAELVSQSPTDVFWGIASGVANDGIGAGRNELGKALQRTRESIRAQAGLGYGSAAKTV